jgi:glycosyltransferase involved in cell wall biosynthesis
MNAPETASRSNLVSVVIPSYNRAELLRITLESVLTNASLIREVIVVDDGSTDHTAAVCESQPPIVRRIYQANAGLSAARNTGIRAATGEWVALCDSDDLWRPNKLSVQLAIMQATGSDWACSGCHLVDPNGHPVPTGGVGFEDVFVAIRESGIPADTWFSQWLDRREVVVGGDRVSVFSGDLFGMLFEGNVVLPSSAVVRRHMFELVGLFDEGMRCGEETEFFHRLSARSAGAIVMKDLVGYRVGHASIVSSKNDHLLMQAALLSASRVMKLRAPATVQEISAARRGLAKLYTRLAYNRLTVFDRPGVRSAVADARRAAGGWTPRLAAVYAASLLPDAALRGLWSLKKRLRSARS